MTGFFPEDLNSWVKLVLELFAIVTAVGLWAVKFIRQPILDQLNGYGSRLKDAEGSVSKNNGKIEALERNDERTNFQVAAMSERQGKLEGKQENHDKWLEEFERRSNASFTKTQERLSAIEAKLDMLLSSRGMG